MVFYLIRKIQLKKNLKFLKNINCSVVFFISAQKLNKKFQLLKEFLIDREILICRELTKLHETFIEEKFLKLIISILSQKEK